MSELLETTAVLPDANPALIKLLLNNIRPVQDANEAHVAFYEQMQSDALGFRRTMLERVGEPAEFVYDNVRVDNEGRWSSSSKIQVVEHPFWTVREQTRYGGSRLAIERGSDRSYDVVKLKIGIMMTGALVLAEYDVAGEEWTVTPSKLYTPADFVDRAIFDKKKDSKKAYREWLGDLQGASKRYARK